MAETATAPATTTTPDPGPVTSSQELNADAPEAAPQADSPAPSGDEKPEAAPPKPTVKLPEAEKPEEEGEPAEEAEPVDYSGLELPEGSFYEDAYLDAFRKTAESAGLTAEQAQALLNAESEGFVEARNQWLKQVREDKELGGDNLARTEQRIKSVVTTYGPDGMLDRLAASGLGAHPDFVALCNSIGAHMAEPETVVTGDQPADSRSTWERLGFPGKPPQPIA